MIKKGIQILLLVLAIMMCFTACQTNNGTEDSTPKQSTTGANSTDFSTSTTLNQETEKDSQLTDGQIQKILQKFADKSPSKWSEKFDGIVDTFETDEKAVALTFDACGGANGSGFDRELVDFLINEQICATFFVNKRWIENNKELFVSLAKNPIFEIENHGFEHRPLSVNANEIYGINGTGSPQRVIDEIKMNEDLIYQLTGKRTKFFRSGTAYYDDVAVAIANEMGYKIAGFQINGDAGATFSVPQIHDAISKMTSGDILISHFNQPSKNTYEGLKDPVLKMKADGYKFLKLEDAIK